jgi:hypothetical protein
MTTDTPFSPGGLVLPVEPVKIRLEPGELVMSFHSRDEWLASGLPLGEWMRQNRLGPYKEADGGDS